MNCKDCKFWKRKKIYKLNINYEDCGTGEVINLIIYSYDNYIEYYDCHKIININSVEELKCDFGNCHSGYLFNAPIHASNMLDYNNICLIHDSDENLEWRGCKFILSHIFIESLE